MQRVIHSGKPTHTGFQKQVISLKLHSKAGIAYLFKRSSSSATQFPLTLATGCLRLFLLSFFELGMLVDSPKDRDGILHVQEYYLRSSEADRMAQLAMVYIYRQLLQIYVLQQHPF